MNIIIPTRNVCSIILFNNLDTLIVTLNISESLRTTGPLPYLTIRTQIVPEIIAVITYRDQVPVPGTCTLIVRERIAYTLLATKKQSLSEKLDTSSLFLPLNFVFITIIITEIFVTNYITKQKINK